MTPHVTHCCSHGYGEVEGTSLAMSQANTSPVPAHVPMFRVPTGLRRVPAAVPRTAVGADFGTELLHNSRYLQVQAQSAHSAHVAECADCTGGCADGLLSSGGYHKSGAAQTICVTVEGKVVVGRRLHHRAGVHRRRPQGQSSPLWPQWAAAWPLVPHSRTLECANLGAVRFF